MSSSTNRTSLLANQKQRACSVTQMSSVAGIMWQRKHTAPDPAAPVLLWLQLNITATHRVQGSGVFYAGYVLFQIPSNLLLSRLGAKLWLPLITAAFGTVAVCSALFIQGPTSFYALRLALGVTEAGGGHSVTVCALEGSRGCNRQA